MFPLTPGTFLGAGYYVVQHPPGLGPDQGRGRGPDQRRAGQPQGDYAGAAIDPGDTSKVWVVGQYIRTTAVADWGTWIAELGPRAKTYTVTPCRVLDTRSSTPPGPIPGSGARSISVAGSLAGLGQGGAADCGVPSRATGVYINVVAVGAAGPGHLTVYPFGSSLPLASTLNFTTGQTVANGVLVPVCMPFASCAAELTIQMGPAAAHVVVDVTGYLAVP